MQLQMYPPFQQFHSKCYACAGHLEVVETVDKVPRYVAVCFNCGKSHKHGATVLEAIQNYADKVV